MAAYLLGIDIGTSGSKALIIDERGDVLSSHTSEYPLSSPQALWMEQEPHDWWYATVNSIRGTLQKTGINTSEIAGIGLTGQMHGLVLLDRHGNVLRPCILWNDQRTAQQCAQITQIVGEKQVLRLTGNPVMPGFTAPKVLWVKQNEPQVYQHIARILLPKDYIRYCLTGEFYSDVSDASGTSLFDVGQRAWSDEICTTLSIPREWLPQVTESVAASSRVSAEAGRITGLVAGTPVVAGAGDQAAGAIGTGMLHEGSVSVSLGTSGVVFAVSDAYRVEPDGRLHSFCHAVPGKWHLMGVMLSAAGSLRWFRDALGEPESTFARQQGRDVYDLIIELASKAPAGCEGLYFLPYLTGERTPYPDPFARGVFFGLTVRHRKMHLARAILEGVAFGLRDSLELMKRLNLPVEEVRLTGGGARSALWTQILADVFQKSMLPIQNTEGAAFGAALLAGVGCGVFSSLEEATHKAVRFSPPVAPEKAVLQYESAYSIYRDLYPLLKDKFKQAAELSESTRDNSQNK